MHISSYLHSSIGRKQIVAVTGLLLIIYVIAHLAGNLFIYIGPNAFNAYAKGLANLRPALNFLEAGLLTTFVVHIYVTALLVLENINARQRYAVSRPKGNESITSR